ncbi:MAG: tRNA (adenosine(37)-N6)-dimethylallyltransferase MiaA [Clostridium sp.]|nr:tRNA (adenosine(37)-N6)-dimethylallyltransferase MiaA [Clostridium sp.]
MRRNKLIVITGPTGSGKTDLAIRVARRHGCDILSADSRQIYKGIPIGTAAPTPEQLAAAPHHFVQELELDQGYSAAQYEADALRLLRELWEKNPVQVMCGGSMMYIDAVCNGIDDLPTISADVRGRVLEIYREEGLDGVRGRLRELDPAGWERVDALNPRRNIHALEICLEAGAPASTLLTGKKKARDFDIEKHYIDLPREELFGRINRRVDAMVAAGLEEEARSVYHLRHLNSLNTVGYKEMFAYFDGLMDRETAIARIAKNTRVYAKKQLTWIKKAMGNA